MSKQNNYKNQKDKVSKIILIHFSNFRYGALILQGIQVTSLNLKENGKWIVGTNRGDITANRVVNAAGKILSNN